MEDDPGELEKEDADDAGEGAVHPPKRVSAELGGNHPDKEDGRAEGVATVVVGVGSERIDFGLPRRPKRSTRFPRWWFWNAPP